MRRATRRLELVSVSRSDEQKVPQPWDSACVVCNNGRGPNNRLVKSCVDLPSLAMLIINGLGSQATAMLGVVRNVTKYPVRKGSLVTGDWAAVVVVGASGNPVFYTVL